MAEIGDIIRNFKDRDGTSRLRIILLCFLAATTFWFLNALNKEHTTTVNYPLDFLYDREAYISLEPLPENVQINVNGVGWNLLKNSLGIKVAPLQIPVENPLDTRKIAANTLRGLISEQLNDFKLNYVLTDTLRIHLDRRERKTVYLSVDTSGISLAPNTGIRSGVSITPDSVVLEGASNALSLLGDTLEIILDDEEITADFDAIVGIDLPPAVSAVNTGAVRIQFEVVEIETRTVRIPVSLLNFPDSIYAATPDYIEVQYRIGSDEENVNPAAFRVIADFEKMNEDSLILPELIAFPERIGFVQLDTVQVRVQKLR